jgi:hypothetical protein
MTISNLDRVGILDLSVGTMVHVKMVLRLLLCARNDNQRAIAMEGEFLYN